MMGCDRYIIFDHINIIIYPDESLMNQATLQVAPSTAQVTGFRWTNSSIIHPLLVGAMGLGRSWVPDNSLGAQGAFIQK